MNVEKKVNGPALTLAIEGRLDTTTAPELESIISGSIDGIDAVTLDLTKLDYISSAGLRVLLSAQKKMTAKGGTLEVTGVNETVSEIFEVTGFSDILTIV